LVLFDGVRVVFNAPLSLNTSEAFHYIVVTEQVRPLLDSNVIVLSAL